MAAATKICALFVGALLLAALAALILLLKIAPPADQSQGLRTTNTSHEAPPETDVNGTTWRELLRVEVRASRRVGLRLRNARIYGGRWMSADAAQFISVDEREVEPAGSFEFAVVSPLRTVELLFDLYAAAPTLDSRIVTFHYATTSEGIDYMRSQHHGVPIQCSPDLVIQGRRKVEGNQNNDLMNNQNRDKKSSADPKRDISWIIKHRKKMYSFEPKRFWSTKGLVPNTIYRVTVRAKNIRAPQFDDKTASDKFASHIDFRTLPKGMPDPPAEIQVEVGPQDGTLLVTWVPVTAESSNGAPITGYAVYADGKKVTDIDSPTGDHALIDISKIISMNPRHVTVRTKSKENQSCDSNATPIPPSAMKGKHHSSKQSGNYNRHPTRNAYGQVIIDPEENLSDKEVYPGQVAGVPSIAEITKDNPTDDNYSEEEFLEAHRSNRNIRYQHPMQPRSHGDPRGHMERVRPSSNVPHDRNSSRPFDRRGYDPRRDNREYHHSPARQGERRRVTDVHGMRVVRGPSTAASAAAHRQHAASSAVPPEDKSRIVVALFDYDPPNMSPNPETCHEELSFVEGDQIRILSGKDPDGFYWGECRGKQGYVPENMITDIENAPKTILDKLNKKRNKYVDIRHSADARKMIALYDYDPHEHSPHSDNGAELSFSEGQIIFVKGQPDNDGFYLGEVDGMQGLVPSNYLQPVDDFPEDAGPHHSGQGNRNVIRPAGQRDRNRGHGPGARGPPPPPRDGMPPRGDPRDRRKDLHSLYENQQDQLRNQARIDESRHPERKIGRELPNFQPDHYATISRENNTSAVTSMPNSDPNRASFRTNRLRGPPNMPELAVNSKPPPATHAGIGLKFPESPNLMQKLSEITGGHASENPVDNILSKGKELIFMKFGLGK